MLFRSLAGERCDPNTLLWAEDKLKVPVVDHWWQTETGWPITANCQGLEPMKVKPGSSTKPVPGWDVQSLDGEGRQVKAGEVGVLAIKLPLPPGSSAKRSATQMISLSGSSWRSNASLAEGIPNR